MYNFLRKRIIIVWLSILIIIFSSVLYYVNNRIIKLNSRMSNLYDVHKKISENNELYGYYNIFTAVNKAHNFKITKIDFDEGKRICSVEMEYQGNFIEFYKEVNNLYISNNMICINNINIKKNDKNEYLMKLSANFIKNN